MKLNRRYATLKKLTDFDDGYVAASPQKNLSLMWELTEELWSLKDKKNAKRRLQRNVAHLVKKQG